MIIILSSICFKLLRLIINSFIYITGLVSIFIFVMFLILVFMISIYKLIRGCKFYKRNSMNFDEMLYTIYYIEKSFVLTLFFSFLILLVVHKIVHP